MEKEHFDRVNAERRRETEACFKVTKQSTGIDENEDREKRFHSYLETNRIAKILTSYKQEYLDAYKDMLFEAYQGNSSEMERSLSAKERRILEEFAKTKISKKKNRTIHRRPGCWYSKSRR